MDDKLNEIKEALSKRTPGRWYVQPGEHYDAVYSSQATMLTVVVSRAIQPDAHLIANAPEYLAYLIQLAEERGKALEFYAEPNNYKDNVTDQWEPFNPVVSDGGEIARQALGKEQNNGTTTD